MVTMWGPPSDVNVSLDSPQQLVRYLCTINIGYWSYVRQLSYLGGLTWY